jgi:hypothetical protein
MIELAVAINNLTAVYKAVKTLTDKTNDLEVKSLIVDMGGQILDLQMAEKEYQLKIAELESEIKRLTSISEKKMILKDGAYYDEITGEGPFCPNCYQKKILNLMSKSNIGKFWCTTKTCGYRV